MHFERVAKTHCVRIAELETVGQTNGPLRLVRLMLCWNEAGSAPSEGCANHGKGGFVTAYPPDGVEE